MSYHMIASHPLNCLIEGQTRCCQLSCFEGGEGRTEQGVEVPPSWASEGRQAGGSKP